MVPFRVPVTRVPYEFGGLKSPTNLGTSKEAPFFLVAEWLHFTLFGIILPAIKLKVCTSWAYELSN